MEIKGYRGENILRITGIVASAMIAAVTLVLDLRSTFLSIDWMFVAWIAAGILVVQLVWYIIYLSNVLASKAPRLVLTNIDTREGPIRDIKGACLAKFVDVQIANDPKHGTEQNHANGVSVQLSYYDTGGGQLMDSKRGRWASSTEQVLYADRQGQDLIRKQLKSDGIPETTTVAFKPAESPRWFVFNDDGYRRNDFQHDSFEIMEPTVDVCIRLLGERIPKKTKNEFWLRLYNEGRDGGIRAEEHALWMARKLSRNRRKEQSRRKRLQRRSS